MASPMWEEWTYCNGLVYSNEFIWSMVLEKFKKTRDMRILEYLTCSEDVYIMFDYLDIVMPNNRLLLSQFGITPEDGQRIFHSIIDKHVWKNEVLYYVLDNLRIVQMK